MEIRAIRGINLCGDAFFVDMTNCIEIKKILIAELLAEMSPSST